MEIRTVDIFSERPCKIRGSEKLYTVSTISTFLPGPDSQNGFRQFYYFFFYDLMLYFFY